MKLPVVSGKEVLRALAKIGFVRVTQTGSHVKLEKTTNGNVFHVSVPIHSNRDLSPNEIHSILKQSGLSREEFERLR